MNIIQRLRRFLARGKRGKPVVPSAWQAPYPNDPAELGPVADSGDRLAQIKLARILAEKGDIEGLTARADRGDEHAQERLVQVLIERGDVEGSPPGPTAATGMHKKGSPTFSGPANVFPPVRCL